MDRRIEKKRWPASKVVIGIAAITTAVIVVAVGATGHSKRPVDSDQISASKVIESSFREYVPVSGTFQPLTSVYLDLEEGGIVEKIYTQSGNALKKGDLVLSFSNTAAQKQNIEAETRLIDNLNQLRNSKIQLTQNKLILKEQLLELEHSIAETQRTFSRYERLMSDQSAQLSKEQFESTREQLTFLRAKRELLVERIKTETALQEQQSAQIDLSVTRVNRNLELLSRIVDSLDVRAPIDGYLSSLNAEVGQSFQRGQRVGQIDQLVHFRVRANVDQYYISKISVGMRGGVQFDGREYELEVTKIYPEVTNDVFQIDLEFIGDAPEGVKRGQTLQIELALSEAKTSTVVAKGSFYSHTNGRWIYIVSKDGVSARRVSIVVGRQNPEYVEVLSGLNPGDYVLTTNYESFGDVEELRFNEPVTK